MDFIKESRRQRMNRKKMIELIIYILIVIVGITLLMTNHLKDKEIKHNLNTGGAKHAVISVR